MFFDFTRFFLCSKEELLSVELQRCDWLGAKKNRKKLKKKSVSEVGFEPTPPDGDQNTRSADTA